MAPSKTNRSATRGVQNLTFRTTPDGVIPSSLNALSSLRLDAATKAALTTVKGKLLIEIDAGGTRVMVVDQNNNIIGGPEELQKLGSIKAFLTRERKEAASKEAAREITQLAYLDEKIIKVDEPDFEMKPVEGAYGAALRPLRAALEQKFQNEKLLGANITHEESDLYRDHALRIFRGIGNAYTRVISDLTKGESISKRLNEYLFEEGVPQWAASRFVSKNFRLERTEQISRQFFPNDPIKGLSLTFREWRVPTFLAKQEGLVARSTLVFNLIKNDEFIRAITQIDASVSLDIAGENETVMKLMAAKIVVLPPIGSATRVIELGSKQKMGFKYPSPGMDSVTNAITSLSTAVLRIYTASLQTVDLVDDYYATIVPNAVSVSAVTPTNNFYVQWGKSSDPESRWKEAVLGGPTSMAIRVAVWRWLSLEMKLSGKASGRKLAKALRLNEEGTIPGKIAKGNPDRPVSDDPENAEFLLIQLPRVTNPPVSVSFDRSALLLRDLSDIEEPLWKEFQKRVFPPPKKDKDSGRTQSLSVLTNEGKALVHRFEKHSPYVASRMKIWLRGFSDERMQTAAVRITNAEFDEFFLNNEDDNESVQDSDDDE